MEALTYFLKRVKKEHLLKNNLGNVLQYQISVVPLPPKSKNV